MSNQNWWKNQQTRTLSLLLLVVVFATSTALRGQLKAEADLRVQRVISGLREAVVPKGRPQAMRPLAVRMAELHVPGVSVAVIDGGKIAWTRAFGVADVNTQRPVTTATLFEAQSISKAVTATAALALVQSGRLSLDTNVNSYLKSWRIPTNQFQTEQSVTLRRILSHSSGLTVMGYVGYRSGDALPTLQQVLDGERPANSPPVRVDFIPGSQGRYSSGGMEVLQMLLQDVSGQLFPKFMQQTVLAPDGMTHSTFQQPLPQNLWSKASSGHDNEGHVIRGRWPIHPEMAAGGLWTTPTDLAKWALDISRSREGAGAVLKKPIATQMLNMQKAPYGLGVELEGSGRSFQFSHAGSNAGFRAYVVMHPETGQGAVVMTNGDSGDTIVGNLVTSIATEYHWPSGQQTERATVSLSSAQLEPLVGNYSLPTGPRGETVTFEVTRSGGDLYGQLVGLDPRPKMALYSSSTTAFFATSGAEVTFQTNEAGKVLRLIFGPYAAPRIQATNGSAAK